ncbi:MAG: tRNA-dihydrouridine synthase [Planctomycetota bacterium]
MLSVGGVQLQTNLLLAPVAGYFDLAYRKVVRSVRGVPCRPKDLGGPRDVGDGTYGAVGLTCTELLCPHALLREADRAMWRAATDDEDRPVAMQLYGSDADILCEAARWAEARGATIIDINMGCPVDKVTKKHGGSKLLCNPGGTVKLAEAVVKAVRVPVTAKIRLGWDDSCLVMDSLPPRLCDVGIAMITVHGRTTEMRFKPSVRLDGIAATVESVKRAHPDAPVIGNGDIATPADAERMIGFTGCDGVMVARGAMGQPWLFRDIAHRLATGFDAEPMPRAERARLVLDHFERLAACRDEGVALRTIRQRISKYSAHLQPWPGLRRGVAALTSADEFREFWHAGVAALTEADASRNGVAAAAG